MALDVGIDAGGDGKCTGYITKKEEFETDSDGNVTVEWIVRVLNCGSTSGTLTFYYKDPSTNTWVESTTHNLTGYYGYEYGWFRFTGWRGNWDCKLEWSDGSYDYFTIKSPCTPSWACEQPLNGYESDGCGNRRTNSVCNPASPPPPGTGNSKSDYNTIIIIIIIVAAVLFYFSRKS